MLQKQKDYFNRYSENRYEMNHLVLLTPHRKYYDYDFDYYMQLSEGTEKTVLNLIGKIIKYTTKINRYDVLSRYNDHNSSPSARNYHSSEVYFIFNNRAYRYNYYKDRVEVIILQSKLFENNNKLHILGVSDIYNLSRFYSEFSFYLVGLDSGHVAYNVKTVLFDEEIQCRQVFAYDQHLIAENLRRSPKDTVINYVISCDSSLLADDSTNMITKSVADLDVTRYVKPKFDQLIATEHLRKLMNEIRINDYVEDFDICTTYYPKNMSEVHRRRNSLHNVLGNFNWHSDYEKFDVNQLSKHLTEYICNSHYAQKLEFAIVSKKNENYEIQKNSVDLDELNQIWVSADELKNVLHNDHGFLDLRTFQHVVAIYATDEKMIDVGLQNLLLGVGEMMQIVCLYSAEIDYGFRPLKNHNDDGIKRLLNLSGEHDKILYIGLLGINSTDCLYYHI